MSIFAGVIEEIPGISVDCFEGCNLNSSAYFLSHCHSDHMKGLNYDFIYMLGREHKYLYCSQATKIILQNKFGGSSFIRGIDVDSPVCINYKLKKDNVETEEYLDVTCVSANHCIGSVMFLFNKNDISILYTGDFRLSPSKYPKLKFLHYKDSLVQSPLKLTSIYLDTTFLDPKYPNFPDREESIKNIHDVIEDWLMKDPSNIVFLKSPSPIGYECLYMELSELSKRQICVGPTAYNNYIHIPGFRAYVTNNLGSTRIQTFKPKPSPHVLTIWVSALRWTNSDTSSVGKWEENQLKYNVCYSTHCSFNELKAFIEYFKPCKIVPCVYPIDCTKSDTEALLNTILREDEPSHSETQKYTFTCNETQMLRLRSNTHSSSSSDDDWF